MAIQVDALQFGDEEEKPQTPRSDRGRSSTATAETKRSRSPDPLEYEEEDATNVQEVWVNLALPQWPKLQPTDGKVFRPNLILGKTIANATRTQVWHMKLPAYVNIESRPYDPDYYRATLEDAPIDGKAEPLAARSRMIGVRNTIRWKWVTGPDGEPVSSPVPTKLMGRCGGATRGCYGGPTARSRFN